MFALCTEMFQRKETVMNVALFRNIILSSDREAKQERRRIMEGHKMRIIGSSSHGDISVDRPAGKI
jgi:hypothetical protein